MVNISSSLVLVDSGFVVIFVLGVSISVWMCLVSGVLLGLWVSSILWFCVCKVLCRVLMVVVLFVFLLFFRLIRCGWCSSEIVIVVLFGCVVGVVVVGNV